MAESIRTHSSAPDYLQFYPTFRCNLACAFCFNRGLADTAGMEDADPEAFQQLVSIAASLGIGHIDFLGGEPTLHAAIVDMTAMIESAGLTTTMSSNGTRPDILALLSRRFPERSLRIGVSVNDRRADHRLLDYIQTYGPIVKTLFSGRAADIFDNGPFAGITADGVEFRLIYRDAVTAADLTSCVAFDDYYKTLEKMKSDRPKGRLNLKGVYCGGFLPDADSPALDWARCPAGTTKLAVMPDGDVYPCYLLFRYGQFKLGNLLKDDFKTIWENPLLDDFRHFTGNRCPKTGCDLFSRCHGGCPAISYIFNGYLSGPDPRCMYA